MREDQTIITELLKIEKDQIALKSAQRSGGDNIVCYISETEDDWDLDFIITSTSPFGFYDGSAVLTCTFISEEKVIGFTSWEIDVLINGISINSSSELIDASTSSYDTQNVADVEEAKYRSTTTFSIRGFNGMHIQAKVRATSVNKGEMEIVKEVYP